MIYLDNAATTFPKPPAVLREVMRCLKKYGGNPGRASHPLSAAASEKVFEARGELCALFGAPCEENVIFTKSATEALDLAIFGMLGGADRIITTNLEHNSVRRELAVLKRRGTDIVMLDATAPDEIFLQSLKTEIKKGADALVCIHASNVCPRVLPIRKMGALCRRRKVKFILDAAQSAGIYDIDIEKDCIDALCVPGHKGLFGPMGTGAAIFCRGFDFSRLSPRLHGGTGVDSADEDVGRTPPESFEAGTLAVPSIAGLCEGVKFVRRTGTENIRRHEAALYRIAKSELLSLGATLYGDFGDGSVLSFNLPGIEGSNVAASLGDMGICVRAGMHCAPTAHDALGTGGDAVRISFSPMNSEKDVRALTGALYKIKKQ